MKTSAFFFLALASTGMPAFAQSCASPTEIAVFATVSGDTCSGTHQLSYLANGAISTPGNQDVYHLSVSDGANVLVGLTPQAALDGVLFVCRNVCGSNATCVATADGGGAGVVETARLPAGPGDYYVVVGGAAGACGTYSLTVSGPLSKP